VLRRPSEPAALTGQVTPCVQTMVLMPELACYLKTEGNPGAMREMNLGIPGASTVGTSTQDFTL
jgi:hypothetical protein